MQVAQSVLGGSNAVIAVTPTPPSAINAASFTVPVAQNDTTGDIVPRPSTSAPPVSTRMPPSKEVSIFKKM